MGKVLQQQNIRTLLLITSTVIYMLLGAAVFSALEFDEHVYQKKKYLNIYKRLMERYNMSSDDVEELARYLHKRRHVEWSLEPWSFAGSVYFTSVTITTIGYGHSVPQTISGQIFCMLYACIGIPLNLTMFQAIGERMGVLMSFVLRRIKRCLGLKSRDVSLIHLVALGLIIWFAFLCAGAAMFSHYERWDFYRSLYYFFVTLTTIGFGDMVALQEVNRKHPSNGAYNSKTLYIASTLIMIYVGLAIASSVINLLVMRLMELQQPKRTRRTNVSWRNSGPRCSHCKHKGQVHCSEEASTNIVENESIMILQNFEEELAFTSYKQIQENNLPF